MRLALISVLMLCPVTTVFAGGPAFLVADLMESQVAGRGADIGSIVTVPGGVIYFTAADQRHGLELWRSDGTAAGTRLVSDINPGEGDGAWELFATYPEIHLSSTEISPCYYIRLWRSDGSHEGTLAGPWLQGFSACSGPWQLPLEGLAVGDRLFFSQVSELGAELWVSNGASQGSLQVLDLCPGACSSQPWAWAAFDDERALVVTRPQYPAKKELWVSDGTERGTQRITELDYDSLSLGCGARVGDAYLFFASDSSGSVLWRTDGTPDGTGQVLSWNGIQGFGCLSPLGEVAYFSRSEDTGEIWRTDGTSAGTSMVLELGQRVDGSSFSRIGETTVFLAYAEDGSDASHGDKVELWRTDGTTEGTARLAAFDQVLKNGIVPLSGSVVLMGSVGESRQLWVSDGTAAGTRRLAEIDSPAASTTLASLGAGYGAVVFAVSGESNSRLTLWYTDGTESGTRSVKEIVSQPRSSEPAAITEFPDGYRDLAFFSATTDSGRDLWMSDGTTAGTSLHTEGLAPLWQETVAGRLFAVSHVEVDTNSSQSQLWTLQAPGDEPQLLAQAPDIQEMTPVGEQLLFLTREQPDEYYLWVSDSTPTGTERVSDMAMASSCGMVSFQGHAYLLGSASTSQSGPVGLYRSDGDQLDVVSSLPSCRSSALEIGMVTSERFLFIRGESSIWRSDGTAAGTQEIALPFGDDAMSYVMAPVGSSLLVIRTDAMARGDDLWRLSDDDDELVMVHDLRQDGEPGLVWSHAVCTGCGAGDLLFFSLFNEVSGLELWVSDGTTEGTGMLNIYPGTRGSNPQSLTAVDGKLVFAADNGVSGHELWVSDGSESGTRMVADIAPGRDASSPTQFTPVGSLLLFTADDGSSGRELWAIPRQALQARSPIPRQPGGRLAGAR